MLFGVFCLVAVLTLDAAVAFDGDVTADGVTPRNGKVYEVLCRCPYAKGKASKATLTRYCCKESGEVSVDAGGKVTTSKGTSTVATYYFSPKSGEDASDVGLISVRSKSVFILCSDNLNFQCQCVQDGSEVFSGKVDVKDNTIQGCSKPF